ncbi:hypothetical protein ERJ75_000675700 [Trypanosoma vivax]|nr:hypothetical protein TRVL_08650 [Trypanosoma vivax]KAH8614534.1 hypothetical protein ERJ75_000675300 [Trypanosoma vivax]KAH8614562.1 hypothetical protein ERJ75_000675700 [Trypanosoma vivax]
MLCDSLAECLGATDDDALPVHAVCHGQGAAEGVGFVCELVPRLRELVVDAAIQLASVEKMFAQAIALLLYRGTSTSHGFGSSEECVAELLDAVCASTAPGLSALGVHMSYVAGAVFDGSRGLEPEG